MTDKSKPAYPESLLRERVENRRDRHFVRAAFALAQGHTNKTDADSFLDAPDDVIARAILSRGNATIGTTTGSGFGAEIARQSFRAFLTSLAPYSGAARLIALAQPATLQGENSTNYPVRAAGPAVPPWVAEGDPISVSSADFDNVPVGPAKKLGHIVVWSRELSKRSDADSIFATMLREDIVAGLDAAFFATTAVSTAAAAGLLDGVTPITGYAGGDETAMKTDLETLAAAVATGGSGNVTFVMAPERLAKLRIMAPALAASLDVAASAAVPTDRVIAADGAALLVGVDPQPDIFASNSALIHMSSTPLEIVSDAPVTADPTRSVWQTATTAVRVLHDLAFTKRRATAVAYADSVTW